MKKKASDLKFQQRITFLILFLGYATYILNRKSFTFNIPTIKRVENIDTESIGSIVSSLAIGYAMGKFLCGVLADSSSPKYLFSFGLVFGGGINIIFSKSSSLPAYVALWFFNGLFQGPGWPSCAKLLKSWYSPTVFGTLWSILSASMNVASTIGPFICNSIVGSSGSWRYTMQVFGMFSIIAAAFVLAFVHDEPIHAGFSTNNLERITTNSNTITHQVQESIKEAKPDFVSMMKRIFESPFLYVISFGFMITLLCKGVLSTWIPLYLISKKGATKTMASTFAAVMEIGGVFGSVSAGVITDKICILMAKQKKGNPRNYFLIPSIMTLVVAMMLMRTSLSDISSQISYALLLAFLIGFCLYSMLSIVGVMTVESSANDISGDL
ncbi:glucose-6-phosphate exchanger SLC37A4-like isoform X2 [Styela clava]